MIFGYARISTIKEKQKTDRQIQTLNEYSLKNNFKFDEIVQEKISGSISTENRPQYARLRDKLRENDVIIVTDIDRLGRNADNVIMEIKQLKKLGIKVIALDVPYLCEWETLVNNTMYEMTIDILVTLKAHIAEQEREKTIQRINQGLDVARKKGKKLGRPCLDIKNFKKEYKKFLDGKYGNISVCQFCRLINIGRATFYKYVNLLELKKNLI